MNSSNQMTVNQISAASSQFPATNRAQPNFDAGQSQVIVTNSHQLRIDNPITPRPHNRARQLAEFTNWLKQANSITATPPADATHWVVDTHADDLRIEKLYRVDSGTSATPAASSGVDQESSEQTPRTPTIHASPHFPTANYRPPKPQFETTLQTTPLPKTYNDIPTDGFDPMAGLRGKVDELQQKGRIIGDFQQPLALSTASWEVPSFVWPLITDQLLVEPAGSIASLSNNVSLMMSTQDKRLAIASTGQGAGCSTIAMCLARCFAKQGKRILLVDADLAQPKLAIRVGLQQRLSWIQALNNHRRAGDVVVSSSQESICVMPLAPIVARVSWKRRIYDHLGQMLIKLGSEFDLILLDTGQATQMMSEASAPLAIADGVVLVSSDNSTSEVELHRTQAGLLSFGVKRMVVAQNFRNLQRLEPALVG